MVITQQRQSPTNLQVILRLGWSFPLLLLFGSTLPGQETREETAYLQSFSGYGMRSFMGNRWGSVQLNAVNPTDEDRELLVTMMSPSTRQIVILSHNQIRSKMVLKKFSLCQNAYQRKRNGSY